MLRNVSMEGIANVVDFAGFGALVVVVEVIVCLEATAATSSGQAAA